MSLPWQQSAEIPPVSGIASNGAVIHFVSHFCVISNRIVFKLSCRVGGATMLQLAFLETIFIHPDITVMMDWAIKINFIIIMM